VEVFLRILMVELPALAVTKSIFPSPSRSAEFSPEGLEVALDPTAILIAASNEPALN
jgi:hypothetical protein